MCQLIEAAHGRPIRFPTLEIRGPIDKQQARHELEAARRSDLLVFVSSNAVQFAFPLLPDQLPLDIDVAAVGSSTARALNDVGLEPTLVPEVMNSEGLLAMPALQSCSGRDVIVLRGNGGRELLAETLQARGATVRQVEVYRRLLPDRPGAVSNLTRNWAGLVDVVSVTSIAILDNLFTLLGDDGSLLLETPIVTASDRVSAHARERGCERVQTAASALDKDMLRALCALEPSLR